MPKTFQIDESEGPTVMKQLRHFVILILFIVIKMQGDTVFLYAPKEYTTGTDSACELFWSELEVFKQQFKTIYITNKTWIPSKTKIFKQ